MEVEIEQTPLRRFGTPEDIANAVAWLSSEQSSFITGETLNVSGGWYMRP
jgi:3-oxoacyl-[acyl-carrier protein] reductase